MVVTLPAVEKIVNGQFDQGKTPWQIGIYAGGCSLSNSIDTSSKLVVNAASGTDWHIQYQYEVVTKQSFAYQLTYTAVANQTTQLGVMVQERHSPFNSFMSHTVTRICRSVPAWNRKFCAYVDLGIFSQISYQPVH